MTDPDLELFIQFVKSMQIKYPHRNIKLVPEWGCMMVYVDDELKFNSTGYNLLYNVKRLCDALENELI